MKKFLTTPLGRLRLIAWLEGVTLLCMVFITVPLRVFYGVSTFSKILGPLHGGLFLLFIFNTLRYGVEHNWKFREITWKVLIACFIPFGTFYIDYKILRRLETDEDPQTMVYVFKTSVETSEEVRRLKPHLDKLLKGSHWNFDLEDCDKVLRIESRVEIAGPLTQVLRDKGFACEALPD